MHPRTIGAVTASLLVLAVLAGATYSLRHRKVVAIAETTPAPSAEAAAATPIATLEDITAPSPAGSVQTFAIQMGNYSYSIREIRVKVGDTVDLRFENLQGFHDFVIDELGVKLDTLAPDGKQELSFVATKPGVFTYYSSVTGQKALGMVGTLTVDE